MSGIRITGGKCKGRRIAAPTGGYARFTSAKVREAVFDLVGSIDGLSVLDLFAGAGSFTVEALSRGAGSVTAVEANRQTVALIRNNLRILEMDKNCQVLNMDVRYAVPMLNRQGRRFELVFADPPYEMGHVSTTVELLIKSPICHPRSNIVVEHSKREEVRIPSGQGWAVKMRRYGDTVLSIVTCGAGVS
jgi:16S rRNA (guanine966-N2)-methyltransferase